MQNVAKVYLEQQQEIENSFKDKVELEFYKVYNEELCKRGDFGIIRDICNKPKPIEYNDQKIRELIIADNTVSFNTVFNVDVEIIFKEISENELENQNILDNIKCYKVIKINGAYNK
jgi:hypothetical protein